MKQILRKLILAAIVLPLFGISQWTFPDDSVTVGLFQVDWTSLEFEGGVVQNYGPCDSLSVSLAWLQFTYQPPGDFGWACLGMPCHEDTLFFGTEVWMGLGERMIPDSLWPPEAFPLVDCCAPEPDSLPLIGPDHTWMAEIEAKRDSAWHSIESIDVMLALTDARFSIQVFPYFPAQGGVDISVAKLLFFVLRDPLSPPSNVDPRPRLPAQQLLAYPNPFNGSTRIQFHVTEPGPVSLTLYSPRGEQLHELINAHLDAGTHELGWGGDLHPSGIYFAVLNTPQGTQTTKLLLVK